MEHQIVQSIIEMTRPRGTETLKAGLFPTLTNILSVENLNLIEGIAAKTAAVSTNNIDISQTTGHSLPGNTPELHRQLSMRPGMYK